MKSRIYTTLLLVIIAAQMLSFEAFGCPIIVIKQGMDYQKVFAAKNTSFLIKQDIDLQSKTIKIGEGSTLVFRGGSFVNGRLICNETTLKGCPKIEDISGTVTNAVFYSSWVTGQEKLSILCRMKANRIVLDENLTLHTHYTNDFNSVILDGSGHTIKIDYDLYELGGLIRCFDKVKAIRNIHFDFGNHEFHSIGIWIPHRTESLEISNVSFSNLNNATVKKYGFMGIGISVEEVQGYSFKRDIEVDISKVSAYNMRALTDNSGKDGESTMTMVYVNCKVPEKTRNHLLVNVENCSFKEIVVHNNEGIVVANDAACIYVHQDASSTNSEVYINNISGYNFGRRLVKTDGGNLHIEKIRGEANNGGSFCMVGCNNAGVTHCANNATISGLTFKGQISYVIACMVNNSVINTIDADFSSYNRSKMVSGVVFVGDDAICRVEDIKVKGKSFLYSSSSQTRVSLRNVKLITDDSIEGTHFLFNTTGIKSLELSDFVFNIKGSLPIISTYQNANPSISNVNSQIVLRDGTINVLNEDGGVVIKDYSTKHPYSLSIENVTINEKRGTTAAIILSSPTLNKLNVQNVDVRFGSITDAASIINLQCHSAGYYSLSNISCGNTFKSSPITISGAVKSKVFMNDISVKGQISVSNNVVLLEE